MGLFGDPVEKEKCPCCGELNGLSFSMMTQHPNPGMVGTLVCEKYEVWRHMLKDELWCFPIFGWGWLPREEFERALKLRSFQ